MEIMSINNQKEKKYTVKKMLGYELSSDLLIDTGYQRPLSEARVRKICDEFNELVVNLIKVSLRDGKLYVFDGQHTKAALERLNGNKPVMVDVMIYELVGLTSEERREIEAELFALQNGENRHVESALKFRALFEANDPDVLQFHAVTNSAGVLMDFTSNNQDRKLICVKEAWNAWHSLGNSLYTDMLKLVLTIWGGDKDSLQAPIIGGMSRFIKAYHDKYDRQILIDAISGESPLEIIKEGSKIPETSKHKYTRQILKRYNAEIMRRRSVS
jgi:hypothetical protein